ncbi:MAG: DoxX family protein [Nanoarchaeota archaeon]|nr:DoxX family protein [Nanoarchaeota archaeon]
MVADFLIPWAVLPLRLILGILYVTRGYPKIKSPERTATLFLRLKIPSTKLSAAIVAVIEFFGGIALIIGFSTRIVAILLALNIAIFTYLKKSKKKKSFASNYGYELMLLIAFGILIIFGAGNLSIDQTFGWLLG